MYAEKSNTGINLMDLEYRDAITIRDALTLGLRQPNVDHELRDRIVKMIEQLGNVFREKITTR